MKWENAAKDFQLFLTIERGLSANTIENYGRDLTKLIRYLESHDIQCSPIQITLGDLQGFAYHISSSISARSLARILSGLRHFFDYLVFEGYREDNPTSLMETPKIGRKLPDTLSVEEINQIIAQIDLSTPHGERNRTIIETIYSCGLRVSELIALQQSDLYFKEGLIQVTGKGNKQRFTPIPEQTQKYINLYIDGIRSQLSVQKGHEDTVFLNRRGKGLTRHMIYQFINDYAEKAGIKKKVGPHTLRHSFATHLIEGGCDLRAIQQMMGHESITTTEVYVHLDRSYLKKVIEKFHPRK